MRVVRVTTTVLIAAALAATALLGCSQGKKTADKVGKAVPETSVPPEMKGPKVGTAGTAGATAPGAKTGEAAPEGNAAPEAKDVKGANGA